jgi:hypothetical protein
MSASLITVEPAAAVATNKGYVIAPIENSGWMLSIAPAPQHILLGFHEHFATCPRTGRNVIFKLTGRTRRFKGFRVVTLEVFDIDTVVRPLADGSPALWGVKGERLPGIWFTCLAALA